MELELIYGFEGWDNPDELPDWGWDFGYLEEDFEE